MPPVYYTDPSIAFRTAAMTDPTDRLFQLAQMSDRRRILKLQEEEAQLRIEEARREIQRRKAVEEAVRGAMQGNGANLAGIAPTVMRTAQPGGYTPRAGIAPSVTLQQPTAAAAGASAEFGGGLDRAALLQRLSQADPLAALELRGGFEREQAELGRIDAQTQAAKAQTDRDVAATMKDLTADQRASFEFSTEVAGRVAQSILEAQPEQRPQVWQGARQSLLLQPKDSIANQIGQQMPPEYSPELEPHLQQAVLMGQSVKDYLATKEKKATPGVDVPFSPDVEAQKARIAKAGRAAGGPAIVAVQTVDEQGRAVTRFVPKTAGAEFAAPPTADMRNKEAARKVVIPAVNELESLGQRVITEKYAAVQKAKSAGRAVEAALANDPDYRVYQDARKALAGNLAVLQQGSRPSDADINAIWVPMVPDVFKDTKESAALKWRMIRVMSGMPEPEGAGGAGQGEVEIIRDAQGRIVGVK